MVCVNNVEDSEKSDVSEAFSDDDHSYPPDQLGV